MTKYEYCIQCGNPTGKAGQGDDSLYIESGLGPYCEECFKPRNNLDQLRADNLAISLQVKALKDALTLIEYGEARNGCILSLGEASSIATEALILTGNSTAIIAAHDAEVRKAALLLAATVCTIRSELVAAELGAILCKMANEVIQ